MLTAAVYFAVVFTVGSAPGVLRTAFPAPIPGRAALVRAESLT
ncbi:hypothetical protein [Chelativorans xinjiangense]|nr:hypothetical protein [Chelativorans xinjiangense]